MVIIVKKNIVVNATALSKSGALTILKQFLKHAGEDERHQYICFIPKDLKFQKQNNIIFIEINEMSWLKRILWDGYMFQRYLNVNRIEAKKVISLQNTSVNTKIEQVIYLHQPLPFSAVKWSLFKRNQSKLFLYKHFYKIFVLLFAKKNTIFVVQTNWMREALCSQSNIDERRVHVIKPDIYLSDAVITRYHEAPIKSEQILLYPATPLFYKNHLLILSSLSHLKREGKICNIKFQVTFKDNEYPQFSAKVKELELTNHVTYLGSIPYEELISKYHSADIVLFPSYVETFGLPLIEGASLGKPVLCSDLPYSQDVLGGYSGATFLDYQDPYAWANSIIDVLERIKNNSFKPGVFEFQQASSWKDFFKLL